MAAERSSSKGPTIYLVAKLTVRDREKLLEYAQQVEALMARHGGGLPDASRPAVRALEGDWRADVLVLQRWRSRDDLALLPTATALAGPFGTALGVQEAFAAAGPFVAALGVIGLGRLDRGELSHPLDVPGGRRPRATGGANADAPAAA